jgi:hypothetical protein
MVLFTVTVSLRLARISQVLLHGRIHEQFLSNGVAR